MHQTNHFLEKQKPQRLGLRFTQRLHDELDSPQVNLAKPKKVARRKFHEVSRSFTDSSTLADDRKPRQAIDRKVQVKGTGDANTEGEGGVHQERSIVIE